jgi:hypothetical protein
MPASEVQKKFRAGRLHSGSKHGPIVRNPKQARAIQISEARAEGHDIPERKSKRHTKSQARSRRRHRHSGSHSRHRRGYNRH